MADSKKSSTKKSSDDQNKNENENSGVNTPAATDEPDPSVQRSTAGGGRNIGNVQTAIDPGEGVMVSTDETIDIDKVTKKGDESPVVVVQENVWEEFYHPGSRRPSQRLLFVKGQVVQRAAIESMNESRKAAKKAADDEDE